jgi:NADPH:quinone reductase-like Zn-dependent oxidoreductase
VKAARIHAYGGPEVFSVDEVPTLEAADLSPTQVLVEVHASSVNPIDCKIRKGVLRAGLRYKLPRALGMDVSGAVLAVGDAVTRWQVGDEVFASPNPKTPGTYAERTIVEAGELGRKPKNLTHDEAASLPLVFLTAWQALVDKAKLQAGERVLIQAGAGGVGVVAIQIAKHLGATVITTCSQRNTDLVRALGADEVIDYRESSWEDVLADTKVDVVLDALGLADAKRAYKVMNKAARRPRIVGISTGLPERVAKVGPVLGLAGTGIAMGCAMVGSRLRGISSWYITRKPLGSQLDHLADLCERGVIRPIIDTVYPLDRIAEAHAHSDSGRARGKLVVKVL